MKYRKRTDGSLMTKSQLIADNPNTSLPKTWEESTLDFLGVDPVLATPKPTLGDYEVAVAADPVFVGGSWVEAWTVQPMFAEYTDESGTVVTVQDQIDAAEEQRLAKMRASTSISMRQCRLQLLAENKLTDVEAAIAALPESDQAAAQIEWEYAANVDRISPLVTVMASSLSLNDEQVDTMFASAALL